jgi:hypothetical protein
MVCRARRHHKYSIRQYRRGKAERRGGSFSRPDNSFFVCDSFSFELSVQTIDYFVRIDLEFKPRGMGVENIGAVPGVSSRFQGSSRAIERRLFQTFQPFQ